MMNKDDERYESSVGGRIRGIEVIDTSGDHKPAATGNDTPQSVVHPQTAPSGQLVVVKRKRKSPDKPWKKPADMPKRPLSAYNIFFRDERERLLGAGSERKPSSESTGTGADVTSEGKSVGKKGKTKSGIGFSNLAKTIATRWNELDQEIRAPYEEIAAAEKKKYDELVAEWRVKQTVKKKALALAKKEAVDEQKTASRTAPNLYPSDRSLGSFSDTSNPYPTEWFHSGPEHEMPEREDTSSSRSTVPPIVETPSGMPYDNRMHGASMAGHGWQLGRPDPSSYYQYTAGVYDPSGSHMMRYSPDTDRTGYAFPIDDSIRSPMQHDFSPVYRDFYHHSQQSMYPQQSSRRVNDMRMSRAASLPASRHEEMTMPHMSSHRSMAESQEELEHSVQLEMERNAANIRSSRPRQLRPQYNPSVRGGPVYPRSSSMPYVQHTSTSSGSRRRRVHPTDFADAMGPPPPRIDELHDDSYRTLPAAYGRQQMMQASTMPRPHGTPQMNQDASIMDVDAAVRSMNTAISEGNLQLGHGQQQSAPSTTTETEIVQTSLQSLNETLDEDAISFITAMKYP